MALGLAIVFGTGLSTTATAEELDWTPDPVPAGDPLVWDQDADDGGPDTGTPNWNDGSGPNEVFTPGDEAIFGGTAVTVTVVEDVEPAGIRFETSGFLIESDGAGSNIFFEPFDVDDTPSAIDVATGDASGTAEISSIIRFRNNVVVNGDGGDGTLTLSGQSSDGPTVVAATIDVMAGGLTIAATGSIGADDTVVNRGGTLTIAQTVDPMSGAVTSGAINGDVTNVAGSTTNNGIIGGAVQQDGGAITNAGRVAGSVVVQGAAAQFNNTGILDETLNVTEGEFDHQDGTISGRATVSGDVAAAEAGRLIASGGRFEGGIQVESGGTLQVTADTGTDDGDPVTDDPVDDVTNVGGAVIVDSGVTLETDMFQQQAGTTTINGTLVGPVEMSADDPDAGIPNIFNNFGTVVGDVSVSEGTLENGDGAGVVDEIQGTVSITGTGIVNNNAGGNVTGAVNVGTAGAATPDGGTLNIDGGRFAAPITINSGTVNVLADLDTAADGVTIDNVGGELAIGLDAGGAATLTTDLDLGAGSTTRVRATGTLDNDDGDAGTTDTIVADAGLLINEGTIIDEVRVEDGGTLEIANGTFNGGLDAQGGDINITANSDAPAGGLQNDGSTIMLGSAAAPGIALNGDVINNSGTMTSFGNITGTLTVTALDDGPGVSSRFIQSADTPDGQGVDGAVTVTGFDAANRGELVAEGGNFDNGITVEEFGVVTIGDAVANDIDGMDPAIDDEDPDAAAAVVNNGGSVEIIATGQLTGSLTNNSGTSTIQTGGVLTGGLEITGDEAGSIVNVEGIVRGGAGTDQVTLTDGTLNIEDGADIRIAIIQDDADVGGVAVAGASGGVIEANGGAFSNIIGRDGDIDINGAVTGDVRVEGSDFDIEMGGNLTGTVTMTTMADIDATNNGTLNGQLVSEGGTFDNEGIIERMADPMGDAIVVAGGTVNNNDGDVTSVSRVQSGALVAAGGNFTGGVVVEETAVDTSTFTVTANMTGDIRNQSLIPSAAGTGAVTINEGTIVTGGLQNNTGQATVNGRITGNVVVDGTTTNSEVITNTNSIMNSQARVTGGTLTANGGNFAGGISATAGQTDILGAVTVGAADLVSDDGAVDITGTLTGNVQANNSAGAAAGLVTNTGQVTGSVTVGAVGEMTTGARFENAGNITAGVTVNNGTFSMDAGEINTASTVEDRGVFVVTDDAMIAGVAIFDDGVDNAGGDIRIQGNAQGDIRNTDGLATIDGGFALTGAVSNGDNGVLELDGNINGTLANNGGQVNFDDMDPGAVTVSEASTNQNTGDAGGGGRILVADAATVEFTQGLTNLGQGQINVNGVLNGAVTNRTTGQIDVTAGELGGLLINDFGGTAEFFGESDAAAINNAGSLNIGTDAASTGDLTTSGLLLNQTNGVLTVGAGSELNASSFTNASGGRVELNGHLSSAVTNEGQIFVTNGAGNDGLFGGLVTNNSSQTIYLRGSADTDGMLRFGAGLTGTGTVDVSTNSTNVGDTVEVTGPLSGNNRFHLDINLSDQTGAADDAFGSDLVRVTGPVSGNVVLDFELRATNGRQDDILVLDVDGTNANNFTLGVEGLPDQGEAIIYVPNQITAAAAAGDPTLSAADVGDVYISDALNPGIGALAGSIVLTQSLIGSVINRPSSPFVSGLAYDDPNPCGPGTWARAIGGQADTSGEVVERDNSNQRFDSEISASYTGFQLGGDFACFNGYFDGWDISFGGIGGLNQGSTEQPVFALVGDGSGGLTTGNDQTSVTTVSFDQTYGGVYLTGARDRFSVDLQYRFENTDFTADNEGFGGSSGLGLEESEFSSQAETFSGSVSYAIPFGDSNITLVPTAGFAYSNVETDLITFNDNSSVVVDDFTSETLFVGGTVSRTNFGQDGTSALNQFLTATYYNDLADDPTSVFTPRPDSGQDPRSLVNENLGAYTEISAGLNYLRILPIDAPGGAKQLSASIRGDLRSSEQLSSWGITSQIRIQF